MKTYFRAACVALALCLPLVVKADEADPALKHARKLLAKGLIIDGHNDLPSVVQNYSKIPGDVVAFDLRARTIGQTDIPRLRAGGVGGQFWSVYVAGEPRTGAARPHLELIDLTRRMIDRYPESMQLALTAAQARAAMRRGRIASLIGIEGGFAIENSLGTLRAFYDLGVRYMTLAHSFHTDWSDSGTQVPARHGGLSPFGEEVVREMNRLGMLVDLSHVSEEAALDAMRVTKAPILFSHSAARAICDMSRNVSDTVLNELKRTGGVFMVSFVSSHVDCEVSKITGPLFAGFRLRMDQARDVAERKAVRDELEATKPPTTTIAKVADHIDHVRKIAGVEHVGLGADYDGNSWWPTGLEDVSTYPYLVAELIRRGWTDRELRLLAMENVLNTLAAAERVAARLQATTPASTMKFTPPPLSSGG